ncbi:polar amino acid transport system permease protein [Palleronia salina]|uniref:Polar amino acid transport system permease protein n=1 Tax=Palleronia salina TaxID=313368 RepID=A0A1M6H699_9RHOB|nr:amino acid ABC transporter permease [Palleronia salina]SHJ17690.1 polar amino acid transport system permease protein [Palleronia salina]
MEFRFFEIYRNWDYVTLLMQGAGMSAILTLCGGVIGFAFAIVLSWARHMQIRIAAPLATAYVEFIRNTPLIVQLFFVAFGLPLLLGYAWPFWAHALLALALNFSAYFAEILRAGFRSVDTGQREAAEALGLRPITAFRLIVVPQAIGRMFPSLSSQFVFLFLTTGIIAEIGVRDLTNAGMFIDSRTFRTFEVYITLTAIYISISLLYKAAMAGLYRWRFPWAELGR